MAGVLQDLSTKLTSDLMEVEPDEVIDLGGGELRLYSTKATADKLREAGFLGVTRGEPLGLDTQAVSIEKMQEVDLGTGYQGKKRQIVVSDVVGFSLDGETLRLFHWDGFVSVLDAEGFTLLDQSVSK